MRHPPFFGYDQPLIAEYAKRYGQCRESDFGNENWQLLQCELMSDFVRKARQAIDAVDPKIALEVSFDEKNYYAQGLDVAHWLKSGWVDMIAPGIGDVGEEKYFPLQPFTAMIKTSPRKCLLFPRVEATIYGGDTTAKEEQGLEKIHRRNVSLNMFRELFLKFRAEGADGIRPFNTGYPTLAEALADENGLKCFARNIAPLLDVRQELKTER
ncbi:hypothetical protein SDC9_98903 [bioreactor metagenome]|uniref:Uncharacterized protein n=1 Tax=bioreactor metagenome TaxID=1076179 RepID=A0A645AGK2_9ZZZZ